VRLDEVTRPATTPHCHVHSFETICSSQGSARRHCRLNVGIKNAVWVKAKGCMNTNLTNALDWFAVMKVGLRYGGYQEAKIGEKC
jgi:hypothetical protein